MLRQAFNKNRRDVPHSDETARVMGWLAENTRPVGELGDPDVFRALLTAIERNRGGRKAASNTIRLRRITLGAALTFAVKEKKLLDTNPLAE